VSRHDVTTSSSNRPPANRRDRAGSTPRPRPRKMAHPRPQARRCATGAARRSSSNWLEHQHCWTLSGWHPARAACCAMACTTRSNAPSNVRCELVLRNYLH
jgi:hypothetical protein